MKGKLYGVGTGPGDPELITVKAVRILRSADIIIVPDSGADRESVALEIVQGYLSAHAEVMNLTFPMSPDENERIKSRKENAEKIRALADAGKTVVFLTLGDPLLYSTYIYLLEHLRGTSVEIETVPGVTSFCAIAAASNTPLAMQNEELRIVPLHRAADIKRHLHDGENIVFMKVSSDNARLAEELQTIKENITCVIASKCGRNGEDISCDIDRLYDVVPYMTTVIVKKKKNTHAEGGDNE